MHVRLMPHMDTAINHICSHGVAPGRVWGEERTSELEFAAKLELHYQRVLSHPLLILDHHTLHSGRYVSKVEHPKSAGGSREVRLFCGFQISLDPPPAIDDPWPSVVPGRCSKSALGAFRVIWFMRITILSASFRQSLYRAPRSHDAIGRRRCYRRAGCELAGTPEALLAATDTVGHHQAGEGE